MATKRKKKASDIPSKRERLEATLERLNSAYKHPVVFSADQIATDYLLRRPTGICSLDIAMGGGFPAGAMSIITGPDGAGKGYLLYRTLAEQQRIYGEDFAAFIYSTEFKFDKSLARIAGLKIAYTDDEIAKINASRELHGGDYLTDEEVASLKEQVGFGVHVIDGVIADDGLQSVLEAVESNEYSVVAIDSLGAFQTQAKESALEDGGLAKHAIQSNEAQLLSRFMPALFMNLNKVDEYGRRNLTSVIATNQVRARRDATTRPGMPMTERMKYQSGSGSRALKHGKAFEIEIHKGPKLIDKSVKPPLVYGREVTWELTKAKLGSHDGHRGSYQFIHMQGADRATDLVHMGVKYEIIEQAGAWYTFTSDVTGEVVKTQGAGGISSFFYNNPDEAEHLYNKCLAAAGVDCVYKEA